MTNTELFLTLLGLSFIFLGSLGMLRFPDVYCRAHALTKATTFGIISLLLAYATLIGWDEVGVKIIVIVFFQFTTIPLSGHLLGKIAFKKNIYRWKEKPVDDHRK